MFSSSFMDLVENRFKKFMYCSVHGLKKDYLYKQHKIMNSEVFQDDVVVYLKEDFNHKLGIMDEICNISQNKKEVITTSLIIIYTK